MRFERRQRPASAFESNAVYRAAVTRVPPGPVRRREAMSNNRCQSLNHGLRMIEGTTKDRSGMSTKRVLRVLVADDDADIREFVETVLADEQFSATFADDGRQALEFLEAGEFDLLLTDIRMPGMSGFELVRQARLTHPDL